jgi:hypothetical protein
VPARMVLRRVLIAVACTLVLASGAVLSACGNEKKQGVEEPAREGLALNMAGVDYNVYITRELNPAVPPDEAYWAGPPAAKGETLYGVFLSACNRTDELQDTAAFFTVTDNQHNEFKPETLPRDNPFAYHPTTLKPDECIPKAGSVAQLGPAAASLLVFRLPVTTTENRPLELEIEGVNPGEKLTYELDI